MNRDTALSRLDESYDIVVVGGGATGLGTALDAAARGYRTALVEAEDFAKATSSRSTKLVHGGVRYLQQGNIGLVREALHERTLLLANAPHLVRDLAFVIPSYARWEIPYYTLGLRAYDVLAGRSPFGKTHVASKHETIERIPGIAQRGLFGSVIYHDGQFDDARLALALARTAADRGATVVNYVRAQSVLHDGGKIAGINALDRESGAVFPVRARVVINATGIFVDELRSAEAPQARPLLTLSRGTHIVVPRAVLGGDTAILVPKTSDGRVIFVIPWHEHVVIGTTDIPVTGTSLDPVPDADEIDYILRTVNRYLERPIGRHDVTATFAGLRPLVSSAGAASTAKLSREHLIDVLPSGLVTITGGKWTTYRKMAQDAVDVAAGVAGLAPQPSPTASLPLRGAGVPDADPALQLYGTDARAVRAIADADPQLAAPFHPRLPYIGAEVAYAARSEMARTVDDVLSRRTRALFLDAEAAVAAAPAVARILARELGRPAGWVEEQVRAFSPIGAIGEIATKPVVAA